MRVIFILSTNYAGSHLLTQLLGAHPESRSIGELHNYRKYLERPDERHSVVNDFAVNPWFAGLADLSQQQWHSTILQRIRQDDQGVNALVDNSKRVRWAKQFADSSEFEPVFIHLIRDPRALVRRWEQTYDDARKKRRQRIRVLKARPGWALPALVNHQHDVYCRKWLISNQSISEFMQSVGQQDNVVTYRDLAVDTERTLQQLMPRLGLSYDSRQLDYGAVEHRGTIKREYLAHSKRSEISMDLRWQKDLSPDQIHRITHHPGIQAYLKRVGLKMIADGLTSV